MAFVSRLRSVWPPGRDPDETDEPEDEHASGLFECETCGIVYIASEKETCSNCEGDVQEVRSELRTASELEGR